MTHLKICNQILTQLLTTVQTEGVSDRFCNKHFFTIWYVLHEWSVTYPDIAGLSIDKNKTSEELLGRLYTSLERRLLKALPVTTISDALPAPIGTLEKRSCSRGSQKWLNKWRQPNSNTAVQIATFVVISVRNETETFGCNIHRQKSGQSSFCTELWSMLAFSMIFCSFFFVCPPPHHVSLVKFQTVTKWRTLYEHIVPQRSQYGMQIKPLNAALVFLVKCTDLRKDRSNAIRRTGLITRNPISDK